MSGSQTTSRFGGSGLRARRNVLLLYSYVLLYRSEGCANRFLSCRPPRISSPAYECAASFVERTKRVSYRDTTVMASSNKASRSSTAQISKSKRIRCLVWSSGHRRARIDFYRYSGLPRPQSQPNCSAPRNILTHCGSAESSKNLHRAHPASGLVRVMPPGTI